MSKSTRTARYGGVPLAQAVAPNGTAVTVLSADVDGTFQLSPADEHEILASIAEADAGHTVPADEPLFRRDCR